MLNRIYHPYWVWEDYKAGFFDNVSGANKKILIDKAIEMFNSREETEKQMMFVIDNWKYSCEHNLTNPSMNKIAYIGQAACCVYAGVPSLLTMDAWNKLSKEVQDRSNRIAEVILNEWETKNKNIQLCLNID